MQEPHLRLHDGAGLARRDGIGRRRLLALLAALPFASRLSPAAAQDTGMLPWHHLPDGTFRNPPGSPERGGSSADWRAFLWRRLVQGAPAPEIPTATCCRPRSPWPASRRRGGRTP